jgi:hypothetical protein
LTAFIISKAIGLTVSYSNTAGVVSSCAQTLERNALGRPGLTAVVVSPTLGLTVIRSNTTNVTISSGDASKGHQ